MKIIRWLFCQRYWSKYLACLLLSVFGQISCICILLYDLKVRTEDFCCPLVIVKERTDLGCSYLFCLQLQQQIDSTGSIELKWVLHTKAFKWQQLQFGVSTHTVFSRLYAVLFVSSPQEHLNYVTEISQDELFVLDPELVITETVGTSPGMPDLVDSSEEMPSGPHKFAFPSSSSSPPSSPGPRWEQIKTL